MLMNVWEVDMLMIVPMGYVIGRFGARVALCMNVAAGVGMMGGIASVGTSCSLTHLLTRFDPED